MTRPTASQKRRTLVTIDEEELDQLAEEARRKGLKLATYLRSLIIGRPRVTGAR
jgi:hypothetical protein